MKVTSCLYFFLDESLHASRNGNGNGNGKMKACKDKISPLFDVLEQNLFFCLYLLPLSLNGKCSLINKMLYTIDFDHLVSLTTCCYSLKKSISC